MSSVGHGYWQAHVIPAVLLEEHRKVQVVVRRRRNLGWKEASI